MGFDPAERRAQLSSPNAVVKEASPRGTSARNNRIRVIILLVLLAGVLAWGATVWLPDDSTNGSGDTGGELTVDALGSHYQVAVPSDYEALQSDQPVGSAVFHVRQAHTYAPDVAVANFTMVVVELPAVLMGNQERSVLTDVVSMLQRRLPSLEVTLEEGPPPPVTRLDGPFTATLEGAAHVGYIRVTRTSPDVVVVLLAAGLRDGSELEAQSQAFFASLTVDEGSNPAEPGVAEQSNCASGLAAGVHEIEAGEVVELVRSAQGCVVVLQLWATWCPTCRGEIDDLGLLTARYGRDLTLIAVAVDDDQEDVEDFVAARRIAYPVAWLAAEERALMASVVAQLGGQLGNGVPFYAVFDRRGRFVDQGSGGIVAAGYLTELVRSLLGT